MSASVAHAQFPSGPENELSPVVELPEAQEQRAHLERVKQFLADKQWDEAVETLRKVMESPESRLLPVEEDSLEGDEKFVRYETVLNYSHRLLAEMAFSAPAALDLYRRRVDPLAERWLRQGVAERNAAPLRRIIEQLFVSSYGDDALYQLGEMALVAGDITQARLCFERIHPVTRTPEKYHEELAAPPGRPLWGALKGIKWQESESLRALINTPPVTSSWLAYPDSNIPLADVRARLVLCSIFEGASKRAEVELDLLKAFHPDVEGTLGGKQGKYVELLSDFLSESKTWKANSRHDRWTTFAGSQERSKTAAAPVDIAGRPLWSQPLPRFDSNNERVGQGRWRISEEGDGLLGYHPIVVDGKAIVCDLNRVRVFDLKTGEPAWPGGGREEESGSVHSAPGDPQVLYPQSRSYLGAPRFTLTADKLRVFTRLGSPVTGARDHEDALRFQGSIVGLDLAAQGRLFLHLLPEGPDWSFESAPVCAGGKLFVAMRRRDDTQAHEHIACYEQTSGRLRWRTKICSAQTASGGIRNELTYNLLTLHENTLYLNTNLGAVAAVDIDSGSLNWLTTYPRQPLRGADWLKSDLHYFRDRNPCLFHQGTLVVAPTDTDRVFALDASTGQVLWASPAEQLASVVHLLGVGEGNLICGGDFLYWLDIATGRIVGQFPDPARRSTPGFARADPAGYGRGILAGDKVMWPTRERIYLFGQQTRRTESGSEPIHHGYIDLVPRGLTGGNLVIADGILLISTADKLTAFDPFGP